MPALDIFHNQVKSALIKDGWTITDDPLTIRYGKKILYVDLGAQRLLGAERAGSKIAVEIKSFVGKSDVLDLEQALGQFILYTELLGETDADRILYLAVEEAAYEAVFEEPIGELLLLKKRLRVIVFDSDTEEIRRWIS